MCVILLTEEHSRQILQRHSVNLSPHVQTFPVETLYTKGVISEGSVTDGSLRPLSGTILMILIEI